MVKQCIKTSPNIPSKLIKQLWESKRCNVSKKLVRCHEVSGKALTMCCRLKVRRLFSSLSREMLTFSRLIQHNQWMWLYFLYIWQNLFRSIIVVQYFQSSFIALLFRKVFTKYHLKAVISQFRFKRFDCLIWNFRVLDMVPAPIDYACAIIHALLFQKKLKSVFLLNV